MISLSGEQNNMSGVPIMAYACSSLGEADHLPAKRNMKWREMRSRELKREPGVKNGFRFTFRGYMRELRNENRFFETSEKRRFVISWLSRLQQACIRASPL
jgi:hypothetical protein